jgi:hypothetical protein
MGTDEHRFENAGCVVVFAVLLLFFSFGCSTDKDPVVLLSREPFTQQMETNAVMALPLPKKIEHADELKIREVVYGYLLSRHFWDNGNFSAIFLQGDDVEVDALIKRFSNHIPPIKPSYHADLPLNRTPIDKDTGSPAMILSVDVGEPNADDSVDALGKWYAGGAVTGFYSFIMKKAGDNWEIESVK